MNKFLKVIFIIKISFIVGCSSDNNLSNGNFKDKNTNINDIEFEEANVNKQENIVKKEVLEHEAVEEDENDSYKSNIFDLQINVDQRIKDKLIIEENAEGLKFYFRDKTLINGNVLLGFIDKYTMDSLDMFTSILEAPMYSLVKIDPESNSIFAYLGAPENPYIQYKKDEKLLPEEKGFLNAYYLVERMLIKSDFLDLGISRVQKLPESLDLNNKAGIEIAKDMFNNINNWYVPLKTAMDSKVSDEELFNLAREVGNDSYLTYPEIRQIPFPTYEIGRNISSTIFTFHRLETSTFIGEENERLALENTILKISNNIEIIEKQLKEIEEKY